MKKQNQFEYIDNEEKEIIEAVENGEFVPVENQEEMRTAVMEAAKNYLKKNKNINIRINTHDIQKIKTKAAEKGLPYQTLIAAILHQYANGRIKASF